jgi:hypothetical protein
MRAAALVGLLLAAHIADAQPAADRRAAAMVSADPIRCWWQSDAGAVAIGQAFSVTITCAVIDTDAVQVVPDESRLGVATVQVTPFEILGGTHPSDARSGSRRFFQYQYTLRVIDPDVIGRDINVPSLPIQYRVRSRVNAGSTLEGRELTYVMPALPIKVLSLVPAEATDVRDGSDAAFGAVETLRFRAGLFRILGSAFAVVGLIVGVWAFGPWARMTRRASPESPLRIPARVVLRELASQLSALKSEADRGWTDELIARALRLARMVSSFAIDRPISQRPIVGNGVVDGRLTVSYGLVRTARVTAASSVTADDVARALAELPDAAATGRGQLETLRDGLSMLTEAAYRNGAERDSALLDDALNAAIAAANRLAGERSLLMEWTAGLRRTAPKRGSVS